MKKLIAVLAMVALVSGAAFAQFGGAVFGGVNLLESGTNAEGKDSINGSGGMSRLRVEGSGSSDDGAFGGWLRMEGASNYFRAPPSWASDQSPFAGMGVDMWGYAWWKPIDQFKLILGSNPDSFWGKDGYARWMFYQVAGDVGAADAGNAWGIFSNMFWGGFGGYGALMEITPIDILGLNIALPYIDMSGSEVADIFEAAKLQLNVNLDFGNIALTMDGLSDAGKLFVYFGLGAVENLDLAVGFGYNLNSSLAAAGAALKFGINDSFALKFRVGADLPGKDKSSNDEEKYLGLAVDVMPIIGVNDSMTAFVSLGLTVSGKDSDMEFHFNPYIQIGSEWGPSFWAGFRLWSSGNMKDMHWAVPVAINFAF